MVRALYTLMISSNKHGHFSNVSNTAPKLFGLWSNKNINVLTKTVLA